jgi:competence protein ComEA
MLDPDRADVAQLTRLPGIGPRLAARIVADRDARGPFRAPEALLRVPGIGPRTLERIRGYLRFEPAGERESPSSF